MVHYFTMVEENGTGNAYKNEKLWNAIKKKLLGRFWPSFGFWGFNADPLIFNYWEIQQIKFTLKKSSKIRDLPLHLHKGNTTIQSHCTRPREEKKEPWSGPVTYP